MIPVLGILLVLPAEKVTGIGGFVDAINETFTVYGGAPSFLFGAHGARVHLHADDLGRRLDDRSDRIQAVAAYDGAFFPFFGVFNKHLGTPVRVNVLSGIVSTIFMVAAVSRSRAAAPPRRSASCSTIAISTTLISYLWIVEGQFDEPRVVVVVGRAGLARGRQREAHCRAR